MSRTYDKVALGITREEGSLIIKENKLIWQSSRSGNKNYEISSNDIKGIEWYSLDSAHKMMKIYFVDKHKSHLRLIGFSNENEVEVDQVCNKYLGKKLIPKAVNVSGAHYGNFILKPHEMIFRSKEQEVLFTVPYSTLKQSVIQSRNEVSLEFHPATKASAQRDELTEMRIYIPEDDNQESKKPAYEEFHDTIVKKAGLHADKTEIIARFEKIYFKLPRGRYEIQFFPSHFLFRSETYNYLIEYSQIKRLFIFRQPDDKMAFLIQLDPPIRQGRTTYHYLIMECPEDEQSTVPINLSPEDLATKYVTSNGKPLLKAETEGPTYDVLSRVFMALSKTKIIQAKNFVSSTGQQCVRCSYGANDGLLYPLEKSMFFIWKPATYFRHNEIKSVEFQRVNESKKMFDFVVHTKNHVMTFSGIDRSNYEPLLKYCLDKKNIQVVDREFHENNMKQQMETTSRSTRTRKNLKMSSNVNVEDLLGAGGAGSEDEEEDEDYSMDEDKEMLVEDARDNANYQELVVDDATMNDLNSDEDQITGTEEKKFKTHDDNNDGGREEEEEEEGESGEEDGNASGSGNESGNKNAQSQEDTQ